jgi:DNA-binding LacI/PurR family transcriptional regulator
VSGQLASTSPITTTNKRNYEIAAEAFEKLLEDLRQIIEVEMKKLGVELEEAGVPWTPGRGVPKWKKK